MLGDAFLFADLNPDSLIFIRLHIFTFFFIIWLERLPHLVGNLEYFLIEPLTLSLIHLRFVGRQIVIDSIHLRMLNKLLFQFIFEIAHGSHFLYRLRKMAVRVMVFNKRHQTDQTVRLVLHADQIYFILSLLASLGRRLGVRVNPCTKSATDGLLRLLTHLETTVCILLTKHLLVARLVVVHGCAALLVLNQLSRQISSVRVQDQVGEAFALSFKINFASFAVAATMLC